MPRAREIPSAAKTWALRCHTVVTRTEKDTGRKYKANITRAVLGAADDDGEVAQSWPAAEFSPKAVLERWGAGRYTVDWFDKAGKKCGEHKFTVDEPTGRARAGEASGGAAADDEDAELGAAALRLPKTQIEWMMWQQREERSADRRRRDEMREERERMRQEADERASRDREFLSQITSHLSGREAAAAAAPAAPVDMGREMALLRREMALTIREETQRIRSEILDELPDDDDDAGAKNVGEALNNAGVGLVEGLGEEAPPIVAAALARFKSWLTANGQASTPEAMAQMLAAAQAAISAQTNGAS